MTELVRTISQFLRSGQFEYQIFDLGRRVECLPQSLFEKIEKQEVLYPYPFQQTAWLGVLFWQNQQKNEPIIWFLNFPIDEMGYLQQTSKDAFLKQLMDHLGTNILAQQSGELHSDSMKESPFAFKPKQEKLAIFHALATTILNHSASKYYEHARNYFHGKVEVDQWAFLGMQGIADYVARLDEHNNEVALAKVIPHLPDTPLQAICNTLEHASPHKVLTRTISKKLNLLIAQDNVDTAVVTALLRGLSNSSVENERLDVWVNVMKNPIGRNIEVLAAISGRAWKDLKHQELFANFLENLSYCDQAQFNILLIDLLGIPEMKTPVLNGLRDHNRSEQVREKIGSFFKSLQTA